LYIDNRNVAVTIYLQQIHRATALSDITPRVCTTPGGWLPFRRFPSTQCQDDLRSVNMMNLFVIRSELTQREEVTVDE